MEKAVVDTSVLVKLYVKEPGSAKALELYKAHKNNELQLVVPNIAKVELINALHFGLKWKSDKLVNALNTFDKAVFLLIEPEVATYNTVCKIMEESNIASYDAVYIAIAMRKGIPLITADKKHHRKSIYNKITYL